MRQLASAMEKSVESMIERVWQIDNSGGVKVGNLHEIEGIVCTAGTLLKA